jgi:hypothetical protein
MDQLRAVATELPGVTPTGRKADLVAKIAPAVEALTDQQQQTSDQAPADASPTEAPVATEPPAQAPETPPEPPQPPTEAPTPEPAPEPADAPQEAPQTPTTDDGTTTEGTNTP